jgi:bifunctional non-homologous end joining protein LigD
MIPTTTPIQSASLHFREGSSDKVYHVAIEPAGEGYHVSFAYGRRGSSLSTGNKTTTPVNLAEATKVFGKLVASKLAKGYQHNSTSPTTNTSSSNEPQPHRQTGNEGRDSGIRCQLLNPVDVGEVEELLNSTTFCLQQKFDGRRLMIRKQGDVITGINRRGLYVAIAHPIHQACEHIRCDFLIDGEAVGDIFHAFDLLEVKGTDIRKRRYIDRLAALMNLLPPLLKSLRWVRTTSTPRHKPAALEAIRKSGGEGVVFKDMDAPFAPGRPASGGPQLKFKFVESATFLVSAHNSKRSVGLSLFDGEELVGAGNVTIPPNHSVPKKGSVVEVRYLYAFRESGVIYQPVYLGIREDIVSSDCVVEQLKYKSEADEDCHAA